MNRPRRTRLRSRVDVEGLDDRCLLSIVGLTPAQVENAYGLSGLNFSGQAANGAGQTIAIVDGYNDPNIETELAVFDAANGLPAPPSLRVVSESGNSALPTADVSWAQEEALDVEWAHALAPAAGLVLVEAYSGTIPDLMAGVQTAVGIPGVSVVTMSWSGNEGLYYAPAYDSLFATPGITFVAASGDNGFAGGVQYPASSPDVLAVGGTTLQLDAAGNYGNETPWFGTSGGFSQVETEPAYQLAIQATGRRSTPDVAFDGNPNTGVAVYTINPLDGQAAWMTIAGTSLGAQAWGGLLADADEGRALAGVGPLDSEQTLTTLYSLPASDFHTVDGGFNQLTGLGTPNGPALILSLASADAGTGADGTPAAASPQSVGHKKHHHKLKVKATHPKVKATTEKLHPLESTRAHDHLQMAPQSGSA